MANRKKSPPKKTTARSPSALSAGDNPLAHIDDGLGPTSKESHDLIFEVISRGGGEPFGAPYEAGTATLTEKIVQFLKQKGFFSFEMYEKNRRRNKRNKFTRYGASRYFGEFDPERAKAAWKQKAEEEAKAAKKKKGWFS